MSTEAQRKKETGSVFSRLGIALKITLLMSLVAGLGVVFTSAAILSGVNSRLQRDLESNLASLCRSVCYSVAPALHTNNQEDVRQIILTQVGRNDVTGISVFKADRTLLVSQGVDAVAVLPPVGVQVEDQVGRCTQEILAGTGVDGFVSVTQNLQLYHGEGVGLMRLTAEAVALSLVLCTLAGFWMQRWITAPIQDLASLAGSVSKNNDYSQRAAVRSGDELGSLCLSFNHMLEQINARNQEVTRTTQLVELLEAISRSANQSSTAEEAMQSALNLLGESQGWVGLVWLPEEEGSKTLVCSPHCYQSRDEDKEFLEFSRGQTTTHGQGLPGMAADNGRPVGPVKLDVVLPPERKEVAARAGLKMGYAIPLLASKEVVAVMEFASRIEEPPPDSLLEALAQIGSQIGRVFERHKAEWQLVEAMQDAERANKTKSSFLATMSHEIRTPLNAVLGMAGLLLDTPLTTEQREYARTIRSSGEGLLGIINDILDFSKVEAGMLDLEQVPFDLVECVEGALDLVVGPAAKRGLDLAYTLDPKVPGAIIGDPTRLRQILLNLLSNAVKFTEVGEVELKVTQVSEGPLHELHFSVRDTGVGIPPDRIVQLFSPFTQADSSITRRFGGTGLGLAISKRFVEAMGGRVWIESTVGKGSQFNFTIQAEAAPAPPRNYEQAAQKFTGKRLLVVDDNLTNREILRLRARSWGLEVMVTDQPRLALAWVEEGKKYDLAVLDIRMPEMDGVELARRLRQLSSTLPMVAWTALGRPETGNEDDLFRAFMRKPLRPTLFFEILCEVFENKTRTATVADATFDKTLGQRHPLRILVADDVHVNQRMMLLMLEKLGYAAAQTAGNGVEVLDALTRATFDVILMDVHMPEMDGLEATRRVVQLYQGKRPRIIALTANVTQSERESCFTAGMDDFLSKPVQVDQLKEALIRASEQKGQAPAAPAPPTPAPSRVSSTDLGKAPGRGELPVYATRIESDPILDPLTVANMCQMLEFGGPDAIQSLLELFKKETPQLLANIQKAVDDKDPAALARSAHTLKGSAANFGARRLAKRCAKLETKGKAGDMTDLKELVAALPELLEQAYENLLDAFPNMRKHMAGPGEAPAAEPKPAAAPEAPKAERSAPAPPRSEPVLDEHGLRNLREMRDLGGREVIVGLLETFCDEVPAGLAAIRASLNDPAELKKHAHKVRGAAGNFAAKRLAALCGRLESIPPADEARALAAQLESEYQAASIALHAAFDLVPPGSDRIDPATVENFRAMEQMGGEEAVRELLNLIKEQVPLLLTELRERHGRGEFAEVARLAQSLRESAENFGARMLVLRALELGQAAERQEPAPELVDGLPDLYDQSMRELEASLRGEAAPAPLPALDKIAVLDPTALENLRQMRDLGGDIVLDELMKLVREEMPQHFQSLQKASQESNFSEAQFKARTLRAAAANLGARRVERLCQEMEGKATEKDTSGLQTLCPPLDAELTRALEQFCQTFAG